VIKIVYLIGWEIFMRIHLLSDLHLEFAPLTPEAVDADLVVLAGDIHPGSKGILWAKKHFDVPVLYVPGNHEYYSYIQTMDELLCDMRAACVGSDVHIFDCDTYEIGDTRFLGTTLWTDLLNAPLGGVRCGVIDSDASHIRINDTEGLNDNIAQSLFIRNRRWLISELEKPFAGKTVVITHHAPSRGSMHSQYVGDPWNSCFVTDMEDLMGDRVDLWVHGHTHNNFDYVMSGTRVVCNPRGYPHPFGGWENREFNPTLIVEV